MVLVLRLAGVLLLVVCIGYVVAGLRLAAPMTLDSTFSAAQQVAMQRWRLDQSWPEFLIALLAGMGSLACFTAASFLARR